MLQSGIIGLLIGLSTSYVIITLGSVANPGSLFSGQNLLRELLTAAIMGILIGIATLIFETGIVSFNVQLTLHFCFVTICVFVAGLVGSWFELSDWHTIWPVFLIEVIAYIIIWILIWLLTKREVDEINNLLQNRKRG
nr:DUF3021 domain-containing protein [Lysinibacillus parviboronicapiens]